MNKRILYVVHRYYPYAGGSEYYVQNMAEETLSRGHDAWVYTHQHHGNQNGVKVTSDINILSTKFDLIVVHGDSSTQNIVLSNIDKIPSPVMYMVIKPSLNEFAIKGLELAKYVSWSTQFDKDFLCKYVSSEKMVYVPHGVPLSRIGAPGFKKKNNIHGKMILSCGGFWKHKGHVELAQAFSESNADATLVTTGYWDDKQYRPKDSKNIKTLLLDDPAEAINAISEADLYVMNSSEEGFGLVLLESMLNNTPWASRRVGKAPELSRYGILYDNQNELIEILRDFDGTFIKESGFDYVCKNHSIQNTVDAILKHA